MDNTDVTQTAETGQETAPEVTTETQTTQTGEVKPPDGQGTKPEIKTFTQEQLDEIVTERVAKERARLLSPEESKAMREKQEAQAVENNYLKSQVAALKAEVQPKSVDDVIVLAERLISDEVDIDQAIGQVVEKYPHFLKAQPAADKPPGIGFSQDNKPLTRGHNEIMNEIIRRRKD